MKEQVFEEIGEEWLSYLKRGFETEDPESHTAFWKKRLEIARPSDSEGRINRDVLENFRGSRVSVGDNPTPARGGLSRFGMKRGERAMLKRCLQAIRNDGDESLLRKYPSHPAGNPLTFDWKGVPVTHRWIKHIHHLGMVNRVLGSRLPQGFALLDIGSSYGIFSYLMFREYPGSHHILVDLPNQLIFAHYYLRSCFPEARIAGPAELQKYGSITRDVVENYDFILLPTDIYEKLAADSVDLVTSFACLGELKRIYFDSYVKSPPFRTARYLYTANPVDKLAGMRDAEVCVLDYPILDAAKRLFFGISPVFLFPYLPPSPHRLFGYKLWWHDPFFECITEI
ncbi:putative sugar O-methyltransferase [Hoeflea sp. CAU 1731]